MHFGKTRRYIGKQVRAGAGDFDVACITGSAHATAVAMIDLSSVLLCSRAIPA
jgi:hypothetical protein